MDFAGSGGGGDRDPKTSRTGPATAPTRPRTRSERVRTAPTERASRTRSASRSPKRRRWRWVRWAATFAGLAVVALLALVVIYRFAMPAWTPTMLARALAGEPVQQRWVPISAVSPRLQRAVIASEDSRFCSHRGIDFEELQEAIDSAGDNGPRGASTITMQVVKNVFLWPQRSYIRKVIELPLALVVDAVWPKRRIIEVYLNVAEWGPGLYGIEAVSRQAFGKPASRLTGDEAARLAVSLPSPATRNPRNPEPRIRRLAEIVAARARGSIDMRCLAGKSGPT